MLCDKRSQVFHVHVICDFAVEFAGVWTFVQTLWDRGYLHPPAWHHVVEQRDLDLFQPLLGQHTALIPQPVPYPQAARKRIFPFGELPIVCVDPVAEELVTRVPPLLHSVAVLAEIRLRSPRKLSMFTTKKYVCRIKVSNN